MNKSFVSVLMAILMCITSGGSAYAYPVVSILPTQQFVDGPGTFSISININGLQVDNPNRLLGAFSVDLLFDPAVLTYLPFPSNNWGNALGDVSAGEALADIDFSTPGILHLSEVSLLEANSDTCLLCGGPFLKDLQGNNLSLATLQFFTAATSGTTELQLAKPLFVDADGFPIPLDALNGAFVHVPEPGNIVLLALGFAIMTWRRHAKQSPSSRDHAA